jgi:hypothetical protein
MKQAKTNMNNENISADIVSSILEVEL